MSDLDVRIRSSLERLTDPGPADVDGMWRSLAARRDRRRRRRLTRIGVVAATLTVVVATAALQLWPESNDSVVATSPADSSSARPDAGTSPTASDVPTYSLELAGADLVREDTVTARNSDVAIWGDGQDTYVSLSVRPGVAGTYGAPTGLGQTMVEDAGFPADEGEAWLSEPGGSRTATMWWVHPAGDLWILRAHWYGDRPPDDAGATLRAWALDVETSASTDAPYVLADDGLSLLGFDPAGEKPSRSRVWSYQGHELTLLVLDRSSSAAGLSNLLAMGAPTGHDVPALGQVWAVGQTFGWAVPGSDGAWATLLVPDALAGEAATILDALARA
jgi:hypothetical protein